MFLVNSRYSHFSAISIRSKSKFFYDSRHSFSRSYGVNWPSSLTRDHSSALGFSPHLPVSVCGTITRLIHYEVFLGSMGSTSLFPINRNPHHLSVLMIHRIYLADPPTSLNPVFQHGTGLPFCVTPSLKHQPGGSRILTAFPSPTHFCLGLGID